MEFINTSNAPQPIGAYAQATCHNGFVFVSGQLPLTTEGVIPEGATAQTEQSLRNIEQILIANGTSKEQILKVQIFTTDINKFSEINAEYQRFMGSHTPARAVVEVSALPKTTAIVEIDAIAHV